MNLRHVNGQWSIKNRFKRDTTFWLLAGLCYAASSVYPREHVYLFYLQCRYPFHHTFVLSQYPSLSLQYSPLVTMSRWWSTPSFALFSFNLFIFRGIFVRYRASVGRQGSNGSGWVLSPILNTHTNTLLSSLQFCSLRIHIHRA